MSLQGTVEVRHSGQFDWQTARLQDTFCFGDTIRVLENGRAAVQLRNDALLRLDQSTTLTFSDIQNDRTYVIDLIKGAAHFFSRGSRSLKVVTPYVNAAVEGTEFEVRVEGGEAKVTLLEGRVHLENDQGEVNLVKGQVGVARAGAAPAAHVTVSPRDAVKWALYYPRVLQASLEGTVAESDAQCLVYQAEEKLDLGQVDAAEKNIDEALAIDPAFGLALSLKSVIAVVNNRKDEALALARQAVSAAPEAASSHIALSYARQAAFDLDGALAALEAAVLAEPENAIAWARLSELRLALGDMNGALAAARKATAIQPDLSHTQTVLGYAYLEQVKLEKAREAFEIAISLDSSAPLPRLGFGLTKIHQGKIIEGRRLIEVAAGLDPTNSVFRSYLGKAYFEEKRDQFSANQFEIAKELDPMDPTPWLYSAIRKQSINRPVEALYDLQQSIKLNDNRAVYRSRFQLDQDLAVRGTSLARVYNDLGFQQLGLMEGWKSLNIDPANSGAHQLMADSYSVLPRHEIARVSELLQAQLFQPVIATPVSAGLSKINLTLMESSLLGATQFPTDFSMITRNNLQLQATGLTGSNGLFGGDVVMSGIQGRLSFSAGYNHFSSDGFWENNDQTGNLAETFVQLQLTNDTNVQVEYRYEDSESGDLNALFYPANNHSIYRGKESERLVRLGLHHEFTKGLDFIFSGIYENGDEEDSFHSDLPRGGRSGIKVISAHKKMLLELQQHFKVMNLLMLIGGGFFSADSAVSSHINSYSLGEDTHRRDQTNIYLYTYTSFPERIAWTFGVDFSQYDDGETDGNQVNPKFGAVWQATDSTTVHLSGFRTLRRMLPESSQTIEPTQIAGFNQFFDDPSGTDTWHFGIGMDHRFSPSLFGGAEYFKRDITFQFYTQIVTSVPPPISIKTTSDWMDKTFRAYIYYTPDERLSTSLEIFYESLDRDDVLGSPSRLRRSDTWRVPVAIHFFHPAGLIAGFKETYIHQDGEFGDSYTGYVAGSDAFLVSDAFLGYRFPKRWGTATLEARNLFDQQFRFQDNDPANPVTVHERTLLARFIFSF